MLKKKSFIPKDKPIFREVIPQALKFAWTHPTHWLLGVFAAVLFSGGALDIFWKFWNAIQMQGNEIFIGNSISRIWYAAQASTATIPWFAYIKGGIAILFFCVIVLAVIAFSCSCQGALVHAITNYKGKKGKSLSMALTIGSRALVPIAVLNFILLAFIWIARFGASFPLAIALGNDSPLYSAVYIVSFIVFTVLTLGLGVLHIYALNSMIINKSTLAKALEHGWALIRKHWLVTIETIIVQSLVVLVLTFIVMFAGIIVTFPTTILFFMSIINGNLLLFQVTLGLFFAIMLIFALVTTGFITAFQYATWTMMFHKYDEGHVMPKLHRIFNQLFKKS